MTGFEAVMWRAETDPRLRSTGVVLDLLDRDPEWDRLVAAHRWGLSMVPRLSQRVRQVPPWLGPPVWVQDAPMDLDYHLRRIRAPASATTADVLTIAENFAMTPLDTARPLWEALLVEGLADGSAAYLLKIHHCLADGKAMVQLFDLLHSPTARSWPDKPLPEDPQRRRDGPPGRITMAVRGGRHALTAVGDAVFAAAGHPASATASALRWSCSLARVVGPAPAPPSPLFSSRGLPRRVGVLMVPFRDLRAAGKHVSATLNDVFLAAVAGGLRIYHIHQGVPVGELPIAFPVSTRTAADPLGGNRFSGVRLSVPVGVSDVSTRVDIIRRRVSAARKEPALDFLSSVAPLMARVPTSALTRLSTEMTRSIDLQASNVRGLDRPAYIAGARITGMFPFGPAPGPAAMVTLLTHDGTCCIGVTMDAVAITDPQMFMDCLGSGFDEVLNLVGVSLDANSVMVSSRVARERHVP